MKNSIERILEVNGNNVSQLGKALEEAGSSVMALMAPGVQDFMHLLAKNNILIAASHDTPEKASKEKKERKPKEVKADRPVPKGAAD